MGHHREAFHHRGRGRRTGSRCCAPITSPVTAYTVRPPRARARPVLSRRIGSLPATQTYPHPAHRHHRYRRRAPLELVDQAMAGVAPDLRAHEQDERSLGDPGGAGHHRRSSRSISFAEADVVQLAGAVPPLMGRGRTPSEGRGRLDPRRGVRRPGHDSDAQPVAGGGGAQLRMGSAAPAAVERDLGTSPPRLRHAWPCGAWVRMRFDVPEVIRRAGGERRAATTCARVGPKLLLPDRRIVHGRRPPRHTADRRWHHHHRRRPSPPSPSPSATAVAWPAAD